MLSGRWRRIIATLLIAAAVAAGVVTAVQWVARDRPDADAELQGRAPGKPAVSIRESVVEHSRGGRPAWKLNIEEIEVSGGGRAVAASDLREGLIYDEDKPVVRISAGKATYETSDRSFEVTGGVRVVSHRGAIITTESVEWLPETQTLHCPGEVTMRTEGATVRTENLDVVVPEDVARTQSRVQVRTEHGQLSGRNLVYDLQTHAYTIDSIQAVFTVDDAREELGRLR
ncbi:MAG: LPS export ABC transporter periplasmic protein LptC [Armatimonadota bacterium]